MSDADYLQGQVRDESGRPVHEAEVKAFIPGKYRELSSSLTDHEGYFRLSKLPAGDLDLSVRKNGFNQVVIHVSEADRRRQTTITLAAGTAEITSEVSVFATVSPTAASSTALQLRDFGTQFYGNTGQLLRLFPGLTVAQHAEDNSVQAQARTVADLHLKYSISDHWDGILALENMLNANLNEAQNFFPSRLPFESAPLGDIHFSPANPFTLRLGIQYNF